MRFTLPVLVIAIALGSASAASARQGPMPHQHPPGAGAATAGMGSQGGMHGGGCLAMPDEQLDALKRDLGITSAQTPQWNAFAEAVRTNARGMGQMMGHMDHGGAAGQGGMTLPQRLDMHERMMTEHLEALRRMKAALVPLYDALTPAQKAKADAMCSQRDNPQAH